MPLDDDDYGTEIEYDVDLEETLQRAERIVLAGPSGAGGPEAKNAALPDIEDMEVEAGPRSPFAQFRKRGYLSVSDLVATVWCEVQYDYRLRTLPFLPPEKRPEVIKSAKGVEIKVDKVKVEDKERVLKRGEKIHLKLEKEIFPEKIVVDTTTPEDAWGLRLLTMISSLEALLQGGKCRELPVVGFVGDVLVFGIIDEIVRQPLPPTPSKGKEAAEGLRQSSLHTFFHSSPKPQPRTHILRVSDSKTRASGVLPREEDTTSGRLQVMLYKELVDTLLQQQGNGPTAEESPEFTLLPSSQRDLLPKVFSTLNLDPKAEFSPTFLSQARVLVTSNRLRFGAATARTLTDLEATWHAYAQELGLGPAGKTDDMLALVYRRATGSRSKSRSARSKGNRSSKRLRRRRTNDTEESVILVEDAPAPPRQRDGIVALDEEAQLQLAIQRSLGPLESDPELQRALERSLRDTAGAEPATGDIQAAISTANGEGPSPEIVCLGSKEETFPPSSQDTNGSQADRKAPPASDVQIDEIELLSLQNEPKDPAPASPLEVSHEIQLEEPASHTDTARQDLGIASSLPFLAGESSIASTPLSGTSIAVGSHPEVSSPSSPFFAQPQASHQSQPTSSELFASIACSESQSLPIAGQRRPASPSYDTDSEREREEDQIALAVELQQASAPEPVPVEVPVSSQEAKPSQRKPTKASRNSNQAGSIIGTHKFTHDRALLAAHLAHVLGYWRGERDPQGVGLTHARRCGWCEFEDGCEWRKAKAEEAWQRFRARREGGV